MEWAMSGKEAPAPTPKVTKADIRTYLEKEYPILDSKDYSTFIKENTGLDANTTDPATVLQALQNAVIKK